VASRAIRKRLKKNPAGIDPGSGDHQKRILIMWMALRIAASILDRFPTLPVLLFLEKDSTATVLKPCILA